MADVVLEAPAPDMVEPDMLDPGMVDPAMPDPDMDPMPVALFMLLGPLKAEGDPAEFCIVPIWVPDAEVEPADMA